jgi:plasmid stabilization system protein ParE
MSLSIVFRPQAKAEFVEAGTWYENKRTGLASEFMAEIHRCLSLATANPMQFAIHRRDIRCITTKRFPYRIFFRAEQQSIVILAIFHNKRNPADLLTRD